MTSYSNLEPQVCGKPEVEINPEGRWYFVCGLWDLAEGRVRSFKVGGRRIVLAKIGAELRAVAGTCPHEAASMAEGKVERMWSGDGVGEHYQGERCVIVCPWHNFEFDLDTGESAVEPGRMRLKTYPVEVLDGKIFIYV